MKSACALHSRYNCSVAVYARYDSVAEYGSTLYTASLSFIFKAVGSKSLASSSVGSFLPSDDDDDDDVFSTSGLVVECDIIVAARGWDEEDGVTLVGWASSNDDDIMDGWTMVEDVDTSAAEDDSVDWATESDIAPVVECDVTTGGMTSFVTGRSSCSFSFSLAFPFLTVVVEAAFSFLGLACIGVVELNCLLEQLLLPSGKGSICRGDCEIVGRHLRHVDVLCIVRCVSIKNF